VKIHYPIISAWLPGTSPPRLRFWLHNRDVQERNEDFSNTLRYF